MISNESKKYNGRTVEHADALAVGPSIQFDLLGTRLELHRRFLDADHRVFDKQFLEAIEKVYSLDSPTDTGIGDDLLQKVLENRRHVPGKPFLNCLWCNRRALVRQVSCFRV